MPFSQPELPPLRRRRTLPCQMRPAAAPPSLPVAGSSGGARKLVGGGADRAAPGGGVSAGTAGAGRACQHAGGEQRGAWRSARGRGKGPDAAARDAGGLGRGGGGGSGRRRRRTSKRPVGAGAASEAARGWTEPAARRRQRLCARPNSPAQQSLPHHHLPAPAYLSRRPACGRPQRHTTAHGRRRSPRGGFGAPYAARGPCRHRACGSRRTLIAPPQPAVLRPTSPSLASVRGWWLASPPRSRLPPLASPPSAARGLHPHGARADRLPPTLLSLTPRRCNAKQGKAAGARLIQPLPSLTSLPSAPAFPRAASLAGLPAAAVGRRARIRVRSMEAVRHGSGRSSRRRRTNAGRPCL
ncbi:hypothetical protein PVAP13_1KG548125 [Panicum virgatum]|uniref:Uncharacterized protein n=1 Tax=Panicum virgatum TaxID=38727 RepID=A0A8T0Y5H5_PANVG|nr:hypothetical protein PVAP13_1KG548125 [Panicum virgatum]